MRCVAVIETERPGLDSVILWDRNGELVAFAYQDGRVAMTRPLSAATVDQALQETRDNFQIPAGQAIRLTDWTSQAEPIPTASTRTRW